MLYFFDTLELVNQAYLADLALLELRFQSWLVVYSTSSVSSFWILAIRFGQARRDDWGTKAVVSKVVQIIAGRFDALIELFTG